MATTPTTTSGALPSLLDLLAPTALPSGVKAGQAFDALLNEPPTPQVETDSPHRRVPEQSPPDGPIADSLHARSPADVSEQLAEDDAEQVDSSLEGASSAVDAVDDGAMADQDAATPADGVTTNELAATDDEPVVAESLAGMTFCVLPVPSARATERGEEAAPVSSELTGSKRGILHHRKAGDQPGERIAATARANEAPGQNLAVEQAEQNVKPVIATEVVGNAEQAGAETKDSDAIAEESLLQTVEQPIELVSERRVAQSPGEDSELAATMMDQPVDMAVPSLNTASAIDTATPTYETPLAVAAVVQAAPASAESARSSNPAATTSSVNPTGQTLRSRLHSEMLASDTGRAARNPASNIDATRLLNRVARAFAAARQRDGEIQLRLSPPELGSLRLTLQMQDAGLVARVETETPAAKTAILDNLSALRERLAEQGVRIERFDVDLMQRQPGGMPDRPGDQQREAPAVPRPEPASRPRTESSMAPRGVPITSNSLTGLNVIV